MPGSRDPSRLRLGPFSTRTVFITLHSWLAACSGASMVEPVRIFYPPPTAAGAKMISGSTTLIAHLGYPTHTFTSPLIYNPWFEQNGIDAVVVPMGVKAEEYPKFLRYLFRLTNIRGALITMPHKVTTVGLVDEVTPTVQIAGAANAVLLREDGTLLGDQFDGAGFVRGVERSGFPLAGKRALVVGNGGVGSAIAAPLAGAGGGALGPLWSV